jgi:hypothetical protein
MHETDARATLQVLRRARASVAAGPFSFHDWAQCTCGHLYIGAAGSAAPQRSEVRSPRPDTPYAAAVVAVARALSRDERRFSTEGRAWYDRRSPAGLAVRWISDYTMRRARRQRDTVKRADAVAVIDEAIASLEAIERRRAPATALGIHELALPA